MRGRSTGCSSRKCGHRAIVACGRKHRRIYSARLRPDQDSVAHPQRGTHDSRGHPGRLGTGAPVLPWSTAKPAPRSASRAKSSLYGGGEVTGPLLRNGQYIKLWNTDTGAYGVDGGKRLYQSHPWVMGVRRDGTAFGNPLRYLVGKPNSPPTPTKSNSTPRVPSSASSSSTASRPRPYSRVWPN